MQINTYEMKRFVSSLLALAALAAVPSCMKEPVSSPDPALGGSPVEVTFQVDLDNVLTKADNTTLDDASGTWNLYVAAFSTVDGSLISTSKIGGTGYEPVETLSGSTQKNITLTLSKGASYKVVFFAEKAGAYDVSFADNKVAKFSFKSSSLLANSAGLDAFFATVDVSSSTTVYSVTLKRPFAQVNVLVPLTAVPQGQTAFSSAMKVKAPTTFDLFAGAATGDASVVEFINSTITASPWGKYADTHKWVGMNYVLVPSDGQVEVTYFKESGMPVAITPGKVPAKMNGRTNLVGNIYDLSTDFNFTVQIGIGFDSEKEEPVIADETVITFADNSTYTTQNPLTIDASTTATQNVILRVNGHTFAEVLAGAAQGATITATSANPAIAKVAVSGNEVVITPVGNGETIITVTTPAYTKADYREASFEIPIKVDGISGGGGQGEQPEPPAGVQAVTVAQFLAASPSETQKYQLTGKITGTVNATYGNFDLEDATGKVYVYGLTKTDLGYGSTNDKSFASLGLKAGDTVTLIGYRYTFTKEGQEDKIEVMYAYYVSHESGSSEGSGGEQGGGEQGEGGQGGGQPEPPAGVQAVTVAQFNAAAPSETQKYQLTGKITGTVNATYGNFDLEDATGKVYVYGLTKTDLGYGSTNDKSFASLGLKAGDTVTLIGYRYTYTKEGQDDKIEVMYAYYVSHQSGSSQGSGGEQGGGSTVSGNTETFTFSALGFANAADLSKIDGQNVTLTFDKGSNTKNGPKYYDAGTNARLYSNNTLTISSDKTITKIEFTFADYTNTVNNQSVQCSGHATAACFTDGSFANDTWTGSSKSVVLTNVKDNNEQVRIVSLKITFE